jgi:hypothetical protein
VDASNRVKRAGVVDSFPAGLVAALTAITPLLASPGAPARKSIAPNWNDLLLYRDGVVVLDASAGV